MEWFDILGLVSCSIGLVAATCGYFHHRNRNEDASKAWIVSIILFFANILHYLGNLV